jgi:hypothetical protein
MIFSSSVPPKGSEDGAWEISSFVMGDYNHANTTGILIMEGKYYSWAVYKKESHEFIGAGGGTYKKGGNTAEFNVLFHTIAPEMVGKRIMFARKGGDSKWQLESTQGIRFELKKMKEKADESLEGTWRITERKREGEMVAMPEGPRKTLKFLSKSRFQWVAFNSETREFFGTGGGTYTLENGKYTEHIDFFSRDDTRVGASLSFDYKVEDGDSWHHSGLSSKGDPIYEIWKKQ